MPCFKGIAVSIHALSQPLPEYSVQKQSRVSRVTTYVPVPAATIPEDSVAGIPEPAKFAISITLLTPGLPIPYHSRKGDPSSPESQTQVYARDPHNDNASSHGGHQFSVPPYMPLTNSENETVAAYIYFDGRPKEEVATLLRPGEETWVNSRWVQLSEADGGGLAEREFLFREVGLERWLNGLDLDGADAAATIERRKKKFERRRRRDSRMTRGNDGEGGAVGPKAGSTPELAAYCDDDTGDLVRLEDDAMSSDGITSDDEPPEATGQIKVALFRVMASGEIRKGEYSPTFDANEDDDTLEANGGQSHGQSEDVDHTTSFAAAKTLDPTSISTQTVTGIDGPDNPYATFTFFYRGESKPEILYLKIANCTLEQLQKMGIMEPPKGGKASTKRTRSTNIDFSGLGPLKKEGTKGFSAFRDTAPRSSVRPGGFIGAEKGKQRVDEDSDEENEEREVLSKADDADDKYIKTNITTDEMQSSGELADAVRQIKVSRRMTRPRMRKLLTPAA
jgi:hypothetical protein